MGQIMKVGKKATKVRTGNGAVSVLYHSTEVVNANAERIVLKTGGWKTGTTKARMNQAANQFDLRYNVSQDKGEWFVHLPNGKVSPFEGNEFVIER